MGHEDVDRVTALIKKVASGRTILMVEHNMNVIAGISDTITVLQRGEVLAEGSYAEVSKNPLVIEAYMGSADAALAGRTHEAQRTGGTRIERRRKRYARAGDHGMEAWYGNPTYCTVST